MPPTREYRTGACAGLIALAAGGLGGAGPGGAIVPVRKQATRARGHWLLNGMPWPTRKDVLIERHILGGQLWGSEKQKHAGSCCTPPKQKQKEEEKGKQK
jgi:hypothetical protein